jgi:uncharacterized protein YdhG (YjbR/CyaY superfamily)
MTIKSTTPDEYIDQLPEDRKLVISKLRTLILKYLPEGFEETISYNMLAYVVPKSIYPNGYHCNKEEPLPFLNLASQKNFIALYHMGIYADVDLYNWFTESYKNSFKAKLDIGKSCIRFKKTENIPFELIAELVSKITVNQWIATYETMLKR